MGHIIVLILGLILLAGLVVAATSHKKPKQGRISGHGTAILRDQPSADAPTPGRSVTATKSEAKTADNHTPPA